MALTCDALLIALAAMPADEVGCYFQQHQADIEHLCGSETEALALLSTLKANTPQQENTYILLAYLLRHQLQQQAGEPVSRRKINVFFVSRLKLHWTLLRDHFKAISSFLEDAPAGKLFIRAYLVFEIRRRLGALEKILPNDFKVPLAVYEFIRAHAQACLKMRAVPPLIQTLFDRYIIYCRTHPGFVEAPTMREDLLAEKALFHEGLTHFAAAVKAVKEAPSEKLRQCIEHEKALREWIAQRVKDNAPQHIIQICEILPELKTHIDTHDPDYWQTALNALFEKDARYVPKALSQGADSPYEVLSAHFSLTSGIPSIARPLVTPNARSLTALQMHAVFFRRCYRYEPDEPLRYDIIFPLLAGLAELSAGGAVCALECLAFLMHMTTAHYDRRLLDQPTYRTHMVNLVCLTFAGVKTLLNACEDNPQNAENSLHTLTDAITLSQYLSIRTGGAAHTLLDSVMLLLNFCRHALRAAAGCTSREALQLEGSFQLDLSVLRC